ncbi:unnamed protein product, partial [Oppiella nova]
DTIITNIEKVIRDTISSGGTGSCDEAFYVVDIEDIVRKHMKWLLNIPRVQPYYAVKCNPSPIVLELLAGLGVGFDCASKSEMDLVLDLGIPANRIIYANPCKSGSFIRHARDIGVNIMTFDNELELHKIRQYHPDATLVIRIRVDDRHSRWPLGTKFGAHKSEVRKLLQTVIRLNLQVIGVSFHVGSGCQSAQAYHQAIADAKWVFEVGRELGFIMKFLDIGGGFPGAVSANQATFEVMAQAVNSALELHFPAIDSNGNKSDISIISELGRYYVGSAFTLATNIIAKRCVQWDSPTGSPEMMYYLNDGIYGSFLSSKIDGVIFNPIPLSTDTNDRPLYTSTLWGPTCDSIDCIIKGVVLPELNIGEWVHFNDMGAYTTSSSTQFNGFPRPGLVYHVSAPMRQML